MAVSNGDVLRLDFVGEEIATGQDVVNVYHHQVSSIADVDEADVMTDLLAWAEGLALLLKLFVSTAVAFRRIRVTNFTKHSSVGEADFETTTAGVHAGDPLPAQVAALTQFYTSDLTVRGRKYYGLAGEDAQSQGAWNATNLGYLADVVDYVLEPLDTFNALYTPGVWSTRDEDFKAFTSGSVSQITVTQRRRRRTVGS